MVLPVKSVVVNDVHPRLGDVVVDDDPRRPIIAQDMLLLRRAKTLEEVLAVIGWWQVNGWHDHRFREQFVRSVMRRLRRSQPLSRIDSGSVYVKATVTHHRAATSTAHCLQTLPSSEMPK